MDNKEKSIQRDPHIFFAILNSHITVLYLRFVKKTIFCGKTEIFKIAEL